MSPFIFMFSKSFMNSRSKEFNSSNPPEYFIRKVPLSHIQIRRRLILSNPMNHVSVVFKRSLFFSDSFLESLISKEGSGSSFTHTTAATQTGPNKQPRPASSIPTSIWSLFKYCFKTHVKKNIYV